MDHQDKAYDWLARQKDEDAWNTVCGTWYMRQWNDAGRCVALYLRHIATQRPWFLDRIKGA